MDKGMGRPRGEGRGRVRGEGGVRGVMGAEAWKRMGVGAEPGWRVERVWGL